MCVPRSFGGSAAGRPNIVVILSDDVGYGDLGCYGATRVRTPNLDRLASRGIRFTDAHSSAATCTPTRYSMMTGEYPWRKKGTNILPGDASLIIEPGRTTLPSVLKQAGYTTGCVGKWHLGLGSGQIDWNGEIKPGPLEIGFAYSFIIPATGDRVPCVFVEDHRVAGLDPKDPIEVSYARKVGNEPTGSERPDLLKMKLSHGHDQTIINGISRIGYMSGGKYSAYEGGTRMPFLASWPARIKPGMSDALICQTDLLASFAALTKQELSASAGPDSFNVLPALLGESKQGRDHLVEQGGPLAFRKGQWKLLPPRSAGAGGKKDGGKKEGSAVELYNLAEDLAETRNVAAENPRVVKEMTAMFDNLRAAGRSRP